MAMTIGRQALASLTGNVETALLKIYDQREIGDTPPSNPASQVSAVSSQSSSAGNVLSATAQALSTGSAPAYPGSRERILRVQFNPSQLTVNASAVPQGELDAASGQSRTIAVEDAKIRLAVTLVFDDMQTYDAFMWDKFTAGLTLQGGLNAVKTMQGKKHSVQGQVEALIAALRNPRTRNIGFHWNQFVFTGRLNTLQARYTMFSTSGRPVRAELRLFIQHDMDPALLQSWYNSYNTAFGGDTGNLVKTEQNWSNLLNLNL